MYCASSEAIDPAHQELAAQVGTELAARGHQLVWGGGRVSSMGAVARAARAGGAHTVGVIPRHLLGYEVADHDADELLVTETMRERKAEMDHRADAFLTLAGGLGTLEELFEIWVSRYLGMHAKPLVVLDPDGLFGPLREQIALLAERGFVTEPARAAVYWADKVDEALDVLEREAGRTPTARPAAEEVLESVEDWPAGQPPQVRPDPAG